MKTFMLMTGWMIGVLTLLFLIINLLAGHLLPSLLLLLITILTLPPASSAIQRLLSFSFPGWLTALLVSGLGIGYLLTLIWTVMITDSVFKSTEVETAMMAIYDAQLAQWPTPYESRMVETSWGDVHVVVSGPSDAPPLLLLHASAMANWSWRFNVASLNQQYRTYAIDTIGDANRSVLRDATRYPADGTELARLYAEIADALGVEQAHIVGASFGGFIATHYALAYPERVERLVLLGPMGLTPETGETALRIMGAQFFPLRPVQDATVRWALGEDSAVLAETEDWFRYVVSGIVPRVPRPQTFDPATLQQVQVPVLLIIGTRDSLTGDPAAVRALAENVPDIAIEVLDSGHLIGIEKAEEVNTLVPAFLEQ